MRSLWQIQQGRKCTCEGSDEYCPCQNVQFVDRNADDGEGPTRFTQEPQPGQLLDWMAYHHIPMGIQRADDGLWELIDQSQDTVIASAGDIYDVLKIAYENETQ